ncbi:hypothetical protein [Flavobacterium pallidum]|uniref:Uncharacterized protein n=1 Tax=Flavobacterium pallidum TaxID=2172098 RepID=A0A2S1SJ56_9FLAO|nr:hypothetical protein [Flavobacterium pallidum]AWI26379.1 hypothetical protein HYN49_10965 [Flavobacterium pallidum]
MKKGLFLLITGLLFSCSPQEHEGYEDAYYRFENADKPYLLGDVISKGDIISYKNQDDELLSYKVISKAKVKDAVRGPGTFSGGLGVLENYFDSQQTVMQSQSFPDDNNALLRIHVDKFSDTGLRIGFNFNLWNYPYIDLNGYQAAAVRPMPMVKMQVNGHTYEKVIVLASANTEADLDGNYPRKVNKLYYDVDNGVIGFDDIDGKEWRIVN